MKRRLAGLRQPRAALPLWAWSIVGFAYYLLFFFVLASLLGSTPTPGRTSVALVLVALLLLANASWNWVFFRKKDLRLSVISYVPYPLAALALAFALARSGSPMFTWFLLYLAYLGYGMWWSCRVWRLNQP